MNINMGLVLVAVIAVVGCSGGEFPPPVQILEKQDVELAYPHWSRNAERILFQSNESGSWQIYVMDADGGNVTQLTLDASNNYFPDWSPDNEQICFVSDRDGNEEVYIMGSDGSDHRRLTNNTAREIHPYWTPEGDRILFNSTRDENGDLEIYMMNPDGSSQMRISESRDHETCARLSPTDNRIVYLRNNNDGLDDVFLMDLDDGSLQNLTNTPTRNGWPCWTPSGDGIVFSAMKDGGYKLYHLALESGELTQLTNPSAPAFDGRANISSDGRKIVFNRQVNGEKNTIGIYVLNVETSR